MDRTIPRDQWVASLKEFTARNAGRRTTLEVDSQDLGAQREESDYPLRGVSYDPRDNRIAIMLGDMATVDRRLTRTISAPSGVDLLLSADGHDQALRIRHAGDGQTVLRLIRDR